MKISCSSWSYHRAIDAKQMDQLGFLDACAANELDGVELLGGHFPSTEIDYLRQIKKACIDRFLTIAMLSAGGHLTVADDQKRLEHVRTIARWVEVAEFLGAPLVRFFCGSGQELDAGGPELYEKVRQAMQEIAAIGEKRGIVMSLENHGGTTADQVLSLHRDVGSPYLKLTMDTGNFPPTSHVGPETYRSHERCAPHAAIVHAKFFNVNPDGTDDEFDWRRIHGILAKAGFRGFLSVEYEGKDGDEVAVLNRITKFLRTLR